MLFYLALFFAFLYFKLARVYQKEERPSSSALRAHFFVGAAILSLLAYGFTYANLYLFIPILFVFAALASLMVTVVKLGIFVDGKPLFGMTHVYRYLPALRVSILLLISILWGIRIVTIM